MALTYLTLPHIPHPPVAYIEQAMVHREQCFSGALEGGGNPQLDPVAFAYINRSVMKDGKSYKSRRGQRFPLLDQFTQWCKENIDPECLNGSIHINEGIDPYHGPHLDPYRNYGLLYLIDTGGPTVTTSWWQKKDSPFMYSLKDYPAIVFEDYTNLELYDSTTFELGIWYLINTRALHSVENIEHRRIAIQCDLNDASRLESAVLLKNNT